MRNGTSKREEREEGGRRHDGRKEGMRNGTFQKVKREEEEGKNEGRYKVYEFKTYILEKKFFFQKLIFSSLSVISKQFESASWD